MDKRKQPTIVSLFKKKVVADNNVNGALANVYVAYRDSPCPPSSISMKIEVELNWSTFNSLIFYIDAEDAGAEDECNVINPPESPEGTMWKLAIFLINIP